jgi:hypothetical protein
LEFNARGEKRRKKETGKRNFGNRLLLDIEIENNGDNENDIVRFVDALIDREIRVGAFRS